MPRGWANPKHPLHKQASGTPAGGDLWGKPSGKPACAYSQEYQPPSEHKSIGKMEAKEYREKLAAKHEKALQAYEDAWDSGNAGWAIAATKQWEARMYGDPKQIIESREDSRTDEEIAADIERRKRELGV